MRNIKNIVGSKWLVTGVIGLFCIEAIYIAITSGFPMPFDEQYHFTLIEYYSTHLSPFIAQQPDSLNAVGDATRLPSYLFHYFLSFPLRLTTFFTHDVTVQIVTLRFLNIAMVATALVVFRRFMVRMTNSPAITNLTILLFCLLPVTSMLAGQINYDNAILLCFAIFLLTAQRIVLAVNAGSKITASQLASFVSVGLLGCLVKFTFLPIAAVGFIGLTGYIVHKKAWPTLRISLGATPIKTIAVVILGLTSVGLFAERYGVNVVEYHSLQPDCAAVQSVNSCMQYGPWARNHTYADAAAKDTDFEGRSIVGFASYVWAPLMLSGLSGVDAQGTVADFPVAIKLAMMIAATIVVTGAFGLIVIERRNMLLLVVVGSAMLYFAALFQRNYSEYMSLHEIVAVQGRYMLPFIIPLVAIGIIGLIRQGEKTIETLRLLQQLEPQEAYEKSFNYSSSLLARNRTAQ